MQTRLIEKQPVVAAASKPSSAVRAVVFGLATVGWVALNRDAQAESVTWKLKAGEVLRYVVEEKMTTTSKAGDKQSKGSTTRTINLSWNVKGVSDTGDADVVLRFDRVRMHIETPPFMPYELDSSAAKIEGPEPFASMARQFKAMAGAEFTFKLKPNGAVEDIQIPESTVKSLRAGISEPAGQGTFSEQALKDLFVQSTPPAFPANASEPGTSWSSKPAKIPTPIGNVVVDKVFTTAGPDPKNPAVLLINTETKVTIEPHENAGGSAKIQSQEGKGSMEFDIASGRILSTRLSQKIQMLISAPTDPNQKAEQTIDQTTDTTSTMMLER